jgi:hypothetical protein
MVCSLVLNSLARINQSVDTGSSDLVLEALQASDACLRGIDPAYADKYLGALKTVKRNKTNVSILISLFSSTATCTQTGWL